MAALEGAIDALAVDSEPTAALTLLDTLARAPTAAALVVAALQDEHADEYGFKENHDLKALRLVHPQLRNAVGEGMTKLEVRFAPADAARPPTARRWPRLEELTLASLELADLKALGGETWSHLRSLCICYTGGSPDFDKTFARSLVAALRRTPALRELELRDVELSDDAAAALFRASSAEDAPQLRALTLDEVDARDGARAGRDRLAARGARPALESQIGRRRRRGARRRAELCHPSPQFGALQPRRGRLPRRGECALAARGAGPFGQRLERRRRWARARGALARAPAPPGCGQLPPQRGRLKALVEAAWPALILLSAGGADVAFFGTDALRAAAFAGFPSLEELDLARVRLREAGAALLASRRWPRLKMLKLTRARLGEAGVTALARGAWPALEVLDLSGNGVGALALEDARRWAPALTTLYHGYH
jgi:hypothetical protein